MDDPRTCEDFVVASTALTGCAEITNAAKTTPVPDILGDHVLETTGAQTHPAYRRRSGGRKIYSPYSD